MLQLASVTICFLNYLSYFTKLFWPKKVIGYRLVRWGLFGALSESVQVCSEIRWR